MVDCVITDLISSVSFQSNIVFLCICLSYHNSNIFVKLLKLYMYFFEHGQMFHVLVLYKIYNNFRTCVFTRLQRFVVFDMYLVRLHIIIAPSTACTKRNIGFV